MHNELLVALLSVFLDANLPILWALTSCVKGVKKD